MIVGELVAQVGEHAEPLERDLQIVERREVEPIGRADEAAEVGRRRGGGRCTGAISVALPPTKADPVKRPFGVKLEQVAWQASS